MSAADRAVRVAAADAVCQRAYEAAGGPDSGVALVAVGGYGRGELAPYSDLDLVLLHTDSSSPGEGPAALAERLWYPLWDTGLGIDHAVRGVGEIEAAGVADVRVRLGLLDVRHLAGDPALTLQVRANVLAGWRRGARAALPELRELVVGRHRRVGELAHASVPDLKEAEGGLRDAAVLRALVATWLVDVPHADLERCRTSLLDLRDVVHELAGRGSDRIGPEAWDDLAVALRMPDTLAAQRHVRALGRRMAHLSRLTWRRVGELIDRPAEPRSGPRRPRLTPLDRGVALAEGEVVLASGAEVRRDPTLLLRCAALAAEREVALNPPSVARLVREGAALPEPWDEAARGLFVRLLAAPGLLPVWETLEETGALARVLPEWERIRLLPHASAIHRYTVDRHVIETCREAARRIRRVARPDLLLVAALLHDIGKGGTLPHSVVGAEIAGTVARRMGFAEDDVAVIVDLVRWHLLLGETATTRDLDDPATVAGVAEKVGSTETLELLRLLTEADSLAASPKAWSNWRAELVDRLTERVRAALEGGGVLARSGATGEPSSGLRRNRPQSVRSVDLDGIDSDRVVVRVTPGPFGAEVEFAARDRIGLLADAAATLAWQRSDIRGAQAWSQGEWGCSRWQLADAAEEVDARLVEQRFEAIASGQLDAAARLNRGRANSGLPPLVSCHPGASERATVVEVRAEDRSGLVYGVLAAVAARGLTVSSAHITTVGPQAVDVFYVQEPGVGPLSPDRAESLVAGLAEVLGG